MSIEAMKQALEYLKDNQHHIADNERHTYVMEYNDFIEKLEQAIAETEKQEPVAWRDKTTKSLLYEAWQGTEPLYTHPYVAEQRQPKAEQEPDYWLGYGLQAYTEKPFESATPLYTHPQPKREWVGLTGDEKQKLMWMFDQPNAIFKHFKYMEAIEAKLKQKNGYAEEKNT